jgi:hypothetical protein
MSEARDAGGDPDRWVAPVPDALGPKRRRAWAPLYLRGLLGPGERKSPRPMAAGLGLSGHDQLHRFAASPAWDDGPLWRVLAETADRLVGGPGGRRTPAYVAPEDFMDFRRLLPGAVPIPDAATGEPSAWDTACRPPDEAPAGRGVGDVAADRREEPAPRRHVPELQRPQRPRGDLVPHRAGQHHGDAEARRHRTLHPIGAAHLRRHARRRGPARPPAAGPCRFPPPRRSGARPGTPGAARAPAPPIGATGARSRPSSPLGPFSYAPAKSRAPGLEPFAVGVERGSPTYSSVVVAGAEGPVRRLDDVRGRPFGFGDQASTSSHLVPRAMLQPRAGLVGGRDYRPVHLGTHDAVARAVQAGQVPAGALSKPILTTLLQRGMVQADRLGEIALSDPIPNHPLTVRGGLAPALRERIRATFLDLHDPEVLRAFRVERFAPTTDAAYDVLRVTAQVLEPDLGGLRG